MFDRCKVGNKRVTITYLFDQDLYALTRIGELMIKHVTRTKKRTMVPLKAKKNMVNQSNGPRPPKQLVIVKPIHVSKT